MRQGDLGPGPHFVLPSDGSEPGSAAWIRGTTCTAFRFAIAYVVEDVVRLREALAVAVEQGHPLDPVIQANRPRLNPTGDGCDAASVEEWLRFVRAVTSTPGPSVAVAADDEVVKRIQDVRFTPVRIRAGYDMGETDQLLDRLVAARLRGEPLAPLIAAAKLSEVRMREAYQMSDVDAFLERLVDEGL